MKIFFQKLFLLLLWCQGIQFSIYCQQDTSGNRSIKVTSSEKKEQVGKSYALVYGVSDYEFPETIPTLRYADNDARDFYDFLITTKLVPDSSNIFLRIDADAKASVFFNDFGKILQRLKPNDRIIIYFAGHGDVEKNGVSVGYLLGYSCAGGTYAGGDVIDLELLQKFVNRAIELQAKVILITDACRPGNLPGGDEGRKQTLGYLKSQFVNTIKILSCDQGELSKEMIFPSAGGHGVFTYFLLEALRGMSVPATKEVITLYDIQRYIDDSVRKYTNEKQNPVVLGPRNEVIVNVDTAIRASIIAQRTKILSPDDVVFRAIGKKNYSLSSDDSVLYRKFYDQLKKGLLNKPAGNNAYETFKKVRNIFSDKNLIYDMKTDLSAKLEDAVQPLMNQFIRGQFQDYPDSLFDDANDKLKIVQDELMDSADFRYNEIKAKRIFFIASVHKTSRALYLLHLADSLMPNTAFINFEIGRHFSEAEKNTDSAFSYFNKAILLSPRWSYPRFMIGNIYFGKNDFNRSIQFYQQAILLQPNFAYALFNMALAYKKLKQKDSADYYYRKALALDKNFAADWEEQRNNGAEIVSLGKSIRNRDINEEKMFAGLIPPDVKKTTQSAGKEASDGYEFYSNAYYYNNHGNRDSARYWYLKAAKMFEKAYTNKTLPLAYYYTWGFTYQSLEQIEKAKEIYTLGLKNDTTDLDLYSFGIGWIDDKQENLKDALKYYQISLSYNPHFYQAFNNLGWVHARMKNTDSAVIYYQKALAIKPDFITTLHNLGNLYFDSFADDSAIYYYKTLLPLLSSPDAIILNKVGISYDFTRRYDSAVVYYKKAISILPDEPVFYKNLGNTYYNNKEYENAVEFYEKANTLFPDSNKVYFNLALSYAYVGNYQKAEDLFKKNLKREKDTSGLYTTYYNLGWVYDKQNKLKDALFWYKRCAQNNPGYTNGLNNIGYMYDRLGKTDSAIYWYKQAYYSDPTYTRSMKNLALIYNELYNYDSSLYYYKLLAPLLPSDADIPYQIGLLHYYNLSYDSSIKYFEMAVSIDQGNVQYHEKTGDAYFDAADYYKDNSLYEKAVNHYKEAIQLDSTDYLPLNRLGVSYIYLDKMKEAIEVFELAIKKDALYKNTYEYNLACIYSLQENTGKALNYFSRCLQSGYNDLEHISLDTDLDNIRGLPAFKTIIQKHFKPEEISKYDRLFNK